MTKPLTDAAAALRIALSGATRGLVDREALAELIALAAVAGEHVLVIGPPGTAKSEAVRRTARALGGNLFEYLLGRFTEPSEIFGPVDLKRLKDGLVDAQLRTAELSGTMSKDHPKVQAAVQADPAATAPVVARTSNGPRTANSTATEATHARLGRPSSTTL